MENRLWTLYNWYAVNNPNGLCPEGWRVPDEEELVALASFAGSPSIANAKYLKSCRQVNSPLGGDCTTSEHPRWNASWLGRYGNDVLNFSALPGGLRFSNATYAGLGTAGYWWSSTSFSATASWYIRMEHSVNHTIHQVNALKNYGLSIRCVRNHTPADSDQKL